MNLGKPGDGVFGLVGTWPRQIDAYWDAAKEHAKGRVIAVFCGGNAHLANFLFAPTPLFDFVASANPALALDETAEIVPEEAIRTFLAAPVLCFKDRIKALKGAAIKVLVAGTPPPKEDDAFIRGRFETEPHFGRVAAQLGLKVTEVPLSPPVLRLKLWMALQGVLSNLAKETGATFVPVPSAAQSGLGFLNRSCYANDVTHANRTYGEIMLKELRQAAQAGAMHAAL